ncbi:lipopolysaccharide kinase InaA family protein [Limnoglobus roseus]|uniref:Lipopolysaccharide kinase RfaP n=1 Tax=Limnoglobus roseus TaxID=2598579 RepID=A0A5C1A604_9BACT|nr:lipopolysaccharide kinase InaA family protein [Limnoglobus roseus]QEL14551.1 lipopolysaccharide kinase RfaP [Limnoglobus roseus]
MNSTSVPRLTPCPSHSVLGRLLRGSRCIVAVPGFEQFAGPDWSTRVMHDAAADPLHAKQGRSISYWPLANDAGRPLNLYLKRHYELPRWQGLLATLLPCRAVSPGLAEWEHLRWAEEHGIPVARPVAAGEFRGPWGKLQSFLAVEALAGMQPLNEAIPLAFRTLSSADFAKWKRGLVGEIARLSRELHRRRAFHKDLYLCHFYLPSADCEGVPPTFHGRVFMIDFHRLGLHRLFRLRYQVKDLAQLLFSTGGVSGITDRDRLRFWKLYRSGEWGSANSPREWLRGPVRIKWKRYDRHNKKHANG